MAGYATGNARWLSCGLGYFDMTVEATLTVANYLLESDLVVIRRAR